MSDNQDIKRKFALLSRVPRPEIVDFFVDGDFAKLPEYDSSELSRESRIKEQVEGWEVPENCYGIYDERDVARREAIRQYIQRNFEDYFAGSQPMITLEPWHNKIMVYRKKGN